MAPHLQHLVQSVLWVKSQPSFPDSKMVMPSVFAIAWPAPCPVPYGGIINDICLDLLISDVDDYNRHC